MRPGQWAGRGSSALREITILATLDPIEAMSHGLPPDSENSRIATNTAWLYVVSMTLTLPDDPALADMTESDIRLDLACALFAAGRVSRAVACRIAGMERSTFDQELIRRRIPGYTEEMLDEDLATLRRIFPQ